MLPLHAFSASLHVVLLCIAISESPEIRQMLVNIQSGMDPDEVEALMIKKENDEAATANKKTRRLGRAFTGI